MPIPRLLLVVLLAAGVAACATANETTPPASPGTPGSPAASDNPTSSQSPAASEPSAVASATPGSSSSGDSPDACALLTTDELTVALGRPGFSTKAMPSSGWIASQCAWSGPGGGFFLGVGTAETITAAGDPAALDAKAKLALFKQQASGATDVPGIGDGAVLTPGGIAAYQGDTYLQITNLGLTGDQLTAIAKLAVAKL